MAGRVTVVDAQCRLVMCERIVDVAVFEQQVADVDNRGNAALVGFKGRDERRDGRDPVA